jgi:hypothetical protein
MVKLLVVLLFVASVVLPGQLRTQATGTARYELVESGNWAIRLNRYTGETERRVDDRVGPHWEMVAVPDRPVAGAVARFQVVEREGGAGLYLLDTETGQTWISTDPRTTRGLFQWRKFVTVPYSAPTDRRRAFLCRWAG